MWSCFSFRPIMRRAAGMGFGLSALWISACPAPAAPFRPVDKEMVLYVAPRSVLSLAPRIRDLRVKLGHDPTDLGSALEVARLAIREGRASADPRHYGQAQAALGAFWADPDAPIEARVLRAVIRQALHDFAGAKRDLDAVLLAEPGHAQARLTRAFLLQAIGAPDEAEADCRALPAAYGITVIAVCRARIAALTGSGARAFERLVEVLSSDRRAEPGLRRFAQGIAAEIAASLGRLEEAERLFSASATESADIPSLVAYADFLLDTGRPGAALALLDGRSEADVVLLRLAIAGKAVGDPRAEAWAMLLRERFAIGRSAGAQLHLREEARFELEVDADPKRALRLAEENWGVEKEPADARLVLAAAVAAKDRRAAADVLAFIDRTGLADQRLKTHLDALAGPRDELSDPLLDRGLETR